MKIQDAILYGSKKGGGGVSPSGSIEISENGTYDVTDKAEAVVDVEPDLTTKQITQNGTYQASSDNADGYSAVTVAVPQPSGTKQVTITQNGMTTEDVEDYENAQITVNVPGPSGKITISQNATDIDVSSYALADVNVSGGASNEDAIIERTISGAYTNNNVTKIGEYAFANCTGLTDFNSSSATSISSTSFYKCSNLKNVYIPSLMSLPYEAFKEKYKLESIYCPSVTSIGDNCFKQCYKLSSAIVNSAQSIGQYAFFSCALKEIDFSDLSTIGYAAFYGCANLIAFISRGNTVPTITQADTFKNTPIASGTGYIYVPAALKSQYEAATNWSTYAAQFRALEDYTVDGTTTGDLDPTKI